MFAANLNRPSTPSNTAAKTHNLIADEQISESKKSFASLAYSHQSKLKLKTIDLDDVV